MATMEPLKSPLHKLNVAVSAKLLLAMISQLCPPQILQLPELPMRKELAVIFIAESDTCLLMEALSASSVPGTLCPSSHLASGWPSMPSFHKASAAPQLSCGEMGTSPRHTAFFIYDFPRRRRPFLVVSLSFLSQTCCL